VTGRRSTSTRTSTSTRSNLIDGTGTLNVELPYVSLNLGSTDELIRNDVTIESTAGVRATVMTRRAKTSSSRTRSRSPTRC
jgi:hypothetical protein